MYACVNSLSAVVSQGLMYACVNSLSAAVSQGLMYACVHYLFYVPFNTTH